MGAVPCCPSGWAWGGTLKGGAKEGLFLGLRSLYSEAFTPLQKKSHLPSNNDFVTKT